MHKLSQICLLVVLAAMLIFSGNAYAGIAGGNVEGEQYQGDIHFHGPFGVNLTSLDGQIQWHSVSGYAFGLAANTGVIITEQGDSYFNVDGGNWIQPGLTIHAGTSYQYSRTSGGAAFFGVHNANTMQAQGSITHTDVDGSYWSSNPSVNSNHVQVGVQKANANGLWHAGSSAHVIQTQTDAYVVKTVRIGGGYQEQSGIATQTADVSIAGKRYCLKTLQVQSGNTEMDYTHNTMSASQEQNQMSLIANRGGYAYGTISQNQTDGYYQVRPDGSFQAGMASQTSTVSVLPGYGM